MLPVIVVLLLGLVEIISLVRCTKSLEGASFEAAQSAALGGAPVAIDECVDRAAGNLPPHMIVRLYEFRNYDAQSQSWGAWQTFEPGGVTNPARPGGEVHIRLSYEYTMISGQTFSIVTGAPGAKSIMLISERTEKRQ